MNSDWVWKTFLLCCTLHCIWLANSFNEGTVAVFRGGGRKCTSEKFLRSNWTLDSMAAKNYHQFKWKERERGRKGRRLESGRHRREEILKGGRWRCSTLATPRGPACKKLLHHILVFTDTFSASELNNLTSGWGESWRRPRRWACGMGSGRRCRRGTAGRWSWWTRTRRRTWSSTWRWKEAGGLPGGRWPLPARCLSTL